VAKAGATATELRADPSSELAAGVVAVDSADSPAAAGSAAGAVESLQADASHAAASSGNNA
jgi:hypothetical protein